VIATFKTSFESSGYLIIKLAGAFNFPDIYNLKNKLWVRETKRLKRGKYSRGRLEKADPKMKRK
jgi:hypothetical protein